VKVYRVELLIEGGLSFDIKYFGNKREAFRCARQHMQTSTDDFVIQKIEVEISRAGVLAALNKHASHADNG